MKEFSLPNKSAKRYCNELWAINIKLRDEKHCVICGKTEKLNSHHLISKRVLKYKFNIQNGITLCSGCHIFNYYLSPHKAPWGFEEWMKNNRPEQYKWWVENRIIIDFSMEKSIPETYYDLEEEHKKMSGEYHRIKVAIRYKLFSATNEIIDKYNSGMSSIELSKLYEVSKTCILHLLKRHNIQRRREGTMTKERAKELRKMMIEKFGKKVLQFDKDLNFIAEYPSIYDASRMTGIYDNSIRNNLNGSSGSAGGFIWRTMDIINYPIKYMEKRSEIMKRIKKNSKEYYQKNRERLIQVARDNRFKEKLSQ